MGFNKSIYSTWYLCITLSAGLILAGDYFAQSSYVGCFCSAAAATRAVSDIINERGKIPELETPQPT